MGIHREVHLESSWRRGINGTEEARKGAIKGRKGPQESQVIHLCLYRKWNLLVLIHQLKGCSAGVGCGKMER